MQEQRTSPKGKRTALGDSIFREPSGSISVVYTDPITGKQVGPKIVKGITTKTEAKAWRKKHVAYLLTHRTFRRDESVSQLADRWLETRAEAVANGQLKPKTYHCDLRRTAAVKKHFGITRVDAIDTESVRGFLRALKSGRAAPSGRPLAQKTRADALHCLTQLFDFKIAEEGGGFNPCRGLAKGERPKQQREREPQELPPEQIEHFLHKAKFHAKEYHSLFSTLAFTGMRVREALALRWSDIDYEAKTITVTTSKQRAAKLVVETRLVFLPPNLEKILGREGRMKARWSSDEDFVFSARPGSPKSYRNVRRSLAYVSEKAGFETAVRSHDFRHSLVRNVRAQLRNDSEKLAFARSLGHKDTTMIDKVYGQAREEKEAMAMVAADVLARAGIGG